MKAFIVSIWRRFRTAIRGSYAARIKVVKPSTRARHLAEALRNQPPLSEEGRRAVQHVTARMLELDDPHPDQRYRTIARHFTGASSGEAKLALLEQLVRLRGAKSILEIGTAYGLSAIALALMPERPKIVTIDFFEPQASLGPQNIRSVGADNVECITANKLEALPRLAANGRSFDFVFHDGGHSGDWYVSDFETIAPMLEPESVYVIDDINWDRTPEIRKITEGHSKRTCYQGWRELVADTRVEGAVVVGGSIGILLTR